MACTRHSNDTTSPRSTVVDSDGTPRGEAPRSCDLLGMPIRPVRHTGLCPLEGLWQCTDVDGVDVYSRGWPCSNNRSCQLDDPSIRHSGLDSGVLVTLLIRSLTLAVLLKVWKRYVPI
jgi:hypothetical protein